MTFYSKYRFLSDEEFLRIVCRNKEGVSPIIDELIRRLESAINESEDANEANENITCPVCEANLTTMEESDEQ